MPILPWTLLGGRKRCRIRNPQRKRRLERQVETVEGLCKPTNCYGHPLTGNSRLSTLHQDTVILVLQHYVPQLQPYPTIPICNPLRFPTVILINFYIGGNSTNISFTHRAQVLFNTGAILPTIRLHGKWLLQESGAVGGSEGSSLRVLWNGTDAGTSNAKWMKAQIGMQQRLTRARKME